MEALKLLLRQASSHFLWSRLLYLLTNHSSLGSEITGIAGWLSTVSGLAGGSESVVIANDSSDIYTAGQQPTFHSAQMQTGSGGKNLNTMFYSADSSPLALIET